MKYSYTAGQQTWHFENLAEVMAKATPARSGDRLAGVIARSAEERVITSCSTSPKPGFRFPAGIGVRR